MLDAKLFNCMMGDTLVIFTGWGIHPEPVFKVILWDVRHEWSPDTLYWSHTGTPAAVKLLFKDSGLSHIASEVVTKAFVCRMVLTEKVLTPVAGKKHALSLLERKGLVYNRKSKRIIPEKGYVQSEMFK